MESMKSYDSGMSLPAQASQGKGWIVSLVTHIILICLLFIPMITSHNPVEEEEGITVSLGLPDQGQGNLVASSPVEEDQRSQQEEQPVRPVEEVTPRTPAKKVSQNVITSNEQDQIVVRENEARKKAEAESRQRAAEEARRQEAYNNTKKSYGDLLGGSGKGNTGSPGNQGDPSGDPNAKALEGISRGSGRVGGGLGNRGVVHEPRINDASQKTGRVVISVCVDKAGKVIKADYTQKGSTTTDSELKEIARKAALQFKFTDSDIEEQCGTITVDFKIKGQ
jgi:outer membrane biosynthesis protein TonB